MPHLSHSGETIPVSLLTGFLGSGKTTVLNHLLRSPALRNTAVIINEFGEIGLDHELVEATKDDIALLESGCLCCTMRGDARHIQIEVTEGVMLSQQGCDIGKQLAAMRAAGITVAFDDFGTGYASLVHLKELDYDQIKVDGTFVRALTQSKADYAIVKAIVDMARAMGKHVVAEGVETAAEFEALRELGCSYGQGYLFGRPLGASELQFFRD